MASAVGFARRTGLSSKRGRTLEHGAPSLIHCSEATRLRVDDGRLITGEQRYADFHKSAVCIRVDYA